MHMQKWFVMALAFVALSACEAKLSNISLSGPKIFESAYIGQYEITDIEGEIAGSVVSGDCTIARGEHDYYNVSLSYEDSEGKTKRRIGQVSMTDIDGHYFVSIPFGDSYFFGWLRERSHGDLELIILSDFSAGNPENPRQYIRLQLADKEGLDFSSKMILRREDS